MKSSLFSNTIFVISYLFIALGIWFYWRGHNAPGGGFIGGLWIGLATALRYWIGYKVHPTIWTYFGLFFMILAACCSLVFTNIFFQGLWISIGSINLGTPMLFDLGVMAIVVGFCQFVATAFFRWERIP